MALLTVPIIDLAPYWTEAEAHKRKIAQQAGEAEERLLEFAVSDVALGVHHGDIRGKAVLPPDIEDVADEFGLAIEIGPDDFAGWEGIVFEAHEGEVGEAVAGR